VVAVLAAALVGCGGGGGGTADEAGPTGETTGTTAAPKNGRIVLASEDGRLASVGPDGTDRRDIDGPEVVPKGGIRLLAPGLAFFQSAGDQPDVVLVDARGGKATALGKVEPYYLGPILSSAFEVGGGRRFAVFRSGSGEGEALLVDIKDRKGVPLGEKDDPEQRLFTFVLAPDEQHLLAIGQKTLLLPTDDPGGGRTLDEELAGGLFTPDSRALLSVRHGQGGTKLVRIPVDGGDEQVLTEGENLVFLGMAGSSAVVQEGTQLFLTEKAGDRRSLSSEMNEDWDLYVTNDPYGKYGILEIRAEDEEGGKTSRWGVIDSTSATLVSHPELDGFERVYSFGPAVVLSDISLNTGKPVEGPAKLARLSTDTGLVTISAFDATNPGGAGVRISPDGHAAAVALTRPGTNAQVTLIITEGATVDAHGSVIDWAPDSSALVVIQAVDDQPHAVVVSLDGKTVTDLGPAFDAVWVPE
jgi:hypothetical protein